MLKKTFFWLVISVSISFGSANLQAQALSASESEKLIDYLKKDDITAAHKLIFNREKSGSSARQLSKAGKFLADAENYSPESVERADRKGDVARLFGFHKLALAFYQDAIDRTEQQTQSNGGDSSSYKVAYKAAACAFWLNDYERALGSLNYIEKNGDKWLKEIGEKNAELLKEFVQDPNNIAVRIKFAEGFWIVTYSPIGVQSADAIRFLEETLKLNPTRDETKKIYILIKNTAQTIDEVETAEKYLQRMVAEFLHEDFVVEAAFSTSQFYFSKKQFAEAQKWLDWIIKNNQTNDQFVHLANLGLAEIYEKLGDEAAMIKFLKLVAQNPNVTATNRGIMDTSDAQQVALVRLGKYYKAKRNFEEALKYFTDWQPRSWCGNDLAQSRYEKDLNIAECLIELKREDEALNKNLLPHLKNDGGELYSDAKIPQLVVSIYEKRNALDDFLVFIKPHAANKYNYTAQFAEKLAQTKIRQIDEKVKNSILGTKQ